jgi:hypothetical protein
MTEGSQRPTSYCHHHYLFTKGNGSDDDNSKPTVNGALSGVLEPGEAASVEQLQRIRALVREGMSEKWAKAEVLGGRISPGGRYDSLRPETQEYYWTQRDKGDDHAAEALRKANVYEDKQLEAFGEVVYAGKGGPGYDVYIGRRMTQGGYDLPESPWHNPFKVDEDGTLPEVLEKYEQYLLSRPELIDQLRERNPKTLGCWCAGKHGAPKRG